MCVYQNQNEMNKRIRRLAKFIDDDLNVILFVCIIVAITFIFVYLINYGYNLFTSSSMPEWCKNFPVISMCLGCLSIIMKTTACVVRWIIKSIYHF